MAARPLTRTVVLGIAGVLCVGVAWAVDSPPAAGVGIMLVAAILIDGLRFGVVEARKPLTGLVRSAHPNPCSVGGSMTVRLTPGSGGAIDSSLEETLPSELSQYVTVRPPERGTAALMYDVTPPRRGQWVLGPCFVMRFSSLGLWWAKVSDTSTSGITVWPRTRPLDVSMLARDREGLVGQKGYVQPHQDNTTVRMYNPGDDLRRVHWRSSARQGDLMTRAEEPTDTEHAWAALLVPASAPSSRRELAISLVASWVLEMEAEGYAVDMACGGQTHHGTAHSHLTQLAVLSNQDAARPLPTYPQEGVSLLITTRGSTRTLSSESVLRPSHARRSRSAAIAVVLSDSDADAQIVRSAGWDVLRLEDSVGLEEAGERLARFCDSVRLAGVA